MAHSHPKRSVGVCSDLGKIPPCGPARERTAKAATVTVAASKTTKASNVTRVRMRPPAYRILDPGGTS